MWWRCWLYLLCWLISCGLEMRAVAQTVQFSQPNLGASSSIPPPNLNLPSSQLAPPNLSSGGFANPGTPTFGTPNFSAPNMGTPTFGTPNFGTPGYGAPAPGYGTPAPSWFGTPSTTPAPTWGNATPWNGGNPSLFPNQGSWNPFSPPPPGAYGGANPAPYGGTGQNTLFPNGLWGPNAANGNGIGEPFRFLQHPRISETFLYGADDPEDLSINDIEVAITGAIPNFVLQAQPVYITPTFVMHLWDGPNGLAADLPGSAYSAYLDTFWASDPDRPIGVELGVAVGVFTDFETINQNSVRVMGEGFGVFRLTPTLTGKLGVWYLNRNDLKLLPAGGLVWQPNPQTKFDILFPNPKFSKYLSTMNNADVWWYLAAEYGGGAWTIERADGSGDRVDINDIRVKLGLDWMNQRNWRGYAEIGYAFDRQVVYVVNPADSFKARDTFMASLGFSF